MSQKSGAKGFLSSLQLSFRESTARAFVEIHPEKMKVHQTDGERIVITYPSWKYLGSEGVSARGQFLVRLSKNRKKKVVFKYRTMVCNCCFFLLKQCFMKY